MEYIKTINSPLGCIILKSDGVNLTGLCFEKQKNKKDEINDNLILFNQVEDWLKKYFQGNNCPISFTIKPQGTQFQQLVWQKLLEIPYGQTVSYDDIAREVAQITGKRKCPQAIGQAVKRNPIGIIIPCHRVICKQGDLTGYAGGMDKKIFLLQLEKANFTNSYIQDKK